MASEGKTDFNQNDTLKTAIEERNKKIKADYFFTSFLQKDEELEALKKHISILEYRRERITFKSRLKRFLKKFVPKFIYTILKKALKISLKIAGYKSEVPGFKPTYTKGKALKKIKLFSKQPLISILIPVNNVTTKFLRAAVKSVENQYYQNWELCIAYDDSTNQEAIAFLKNIQNPKIRTTYLSQNGNISKASNEALKIASGEYIGLLNNNDTLALDALFEIADCINERNPDIIYSDEDKISNTSKYSSPIHKPEFSPDLLTSQNYIGHFLVIKKAIIESVGGFEEGLEGAQDYDLILKSVEKTKLIYRIPKILYHERISEDSSSIVNAKPYAQEAMRKSLVNFTKRNQINAEVLEGKDPYTFRLKRVLDGTPLVSIIIPFKDRSDLLEMCINSILKKSSYRNFEIIGVSNNSTEEKTFNVMKMFESNDSRIKFYELNIAFNYSSINNFGALFCSGEHLILLNNDIEIISTDWIEAMLEHSQRPEIGIVGAKLYYPDDTIQHAGVIIGLVGVAGHSHRGYNRQNPGYHSRLNVIQNYSALTGACIMLKSDLYKKLGGLNHSKLSVAYNDIDLCLRAIELNYLNIFTPYCEAYHYESISRGCDTVPEKQKRFRDEINFMLKRHEKTIQNIDPYYNPNLTLSNEDFSLR